jgi:hypothetical protein
MPSGLAERFVALRAGEAKIAVRAGRLPLLPVHEPTPNALFCTAGAILIRRVATVRPSGRRGDRQSYHRDSSEQSRIAVCTRQGRREAQSDQQINPFAGHSLTQGKSRVETFSCRIKVWIQRPFAYSE